LLLVLRGLLGNAMAMGAAPVLAPASAASAASAASQLHHHAPEMAPMLEQAAMAADGGDHAGHAAAHASPNASHDTGCAPQSGDCAEHEHGPSCTLCGICHSALFTPGQLQEGGVSAATALRPQGSERFASAARLQAIKPPIS
jgi:hypothetical protein